MFRKIQTFLRGNERIDALLFCLVGLLVVVWFRRGYFIYTWDTTYPVNAGAYLANFSNVWRSIISTGYSDANGVPFTPYFAIVYLLQNVMGLSTIVAEAILYYFLFVISGISMYIFTHKFLLGLVRAKELRIVSIISGMFYMMNLYTLYYIWRIFTVDAFLLALFPFLAYEIWKGAEKARMSRQIDFFCIARIEFICF